ncbi:MAG: aconitate hydratase [SAR202 cluster bacterium Casp-Chloro-G4]|nr:aconitate hydratase [Chloroflexota bacterium]MDA1227865.1 aconitate hydratase [Chloroflexota bacterium]PKB61473.1 MAG: aconitate hydratase [SAR202 cluster bacterium Casp-Chloro-G4]
MVTIESTPEMAAKVYETIEANLKIVRGRLGKPLTLADKVMLGHLDDPENQEMVPGESYLFLRPDRVLLQDVLGQTAMLQFMQTMKERLSVATSIHCDHLIQARVEGSVDLKESLQENSEVYDFLRSAAAKFGAGFWGPGAGIIHQVALENYAFPGELMIGTDSHTPNAGGLGACSVGVGGADAVETMAGLPWEVLYPRHIAVYLTGELSGWTAPKDVILYVAGALTVSGATNAIVEYIGPGARTISATGKATITNMGAELGATTSMFPYDDHMGQYLRATNRAELVPLAEKYKHLLAPDEEVEADPEKYYDNVVRLDLSTLEPHLVGPHSPDRARPISKMAAEVSDPSNGFVDEISSALIGSCTNSSYEDMSRAADVAEQGKAHGLKSRVPFMVTPGSEQVRATIERDGQMGSLRDIDGSVLANACGPCIGQWRRAKEQTDHANTILTSYNRNFPARNDGSASTMNFIGSPEVVTAMAMAGRLSFNPLTDSLTAADGTEFKLNPPKKAPEVPPSNFATGNSSYEAPPADGSGIELAVAPDSERIQLMQPWPAWDGNDLEGMPVVMKTKGKTTTDHISPAGPWLRYRGHLGKFSENTLMGAINAFTGETGVGKNVLTGEAAQPIATIARHYQSQGVKWVIVGDANYGEGSSREHAALCPRLMGGAAVIVRSFARIHESNLKKQGLLALTFPDPADYDKIQEDDRISLVGLSDIAPGKPVECRIAHADGTSEVLYLNHTFGESQLDWFRLGSALNLFHQNN